MRRNNPITHLLSLAVFLTLAMLGCAPRDQNSTPAQDQEMKDKVANATAKAKEEGQLAARKLDEATKELQHKAKVAAQGVKEGWQRGGTSPSRTLNLNSASKGALADLPGLNADDAQRIVDGRPYRRKHDLVGRDIITAEKYGRIEDRITVE